MSENRPAWVRPEFPSVFSVDETARRAGNYKWLEMRLFETMGGWVALAPELEVKVMMGNHCYHHAFHAEMWHKRLPQLREMNPERLTAAPNPAMDHFVTQMSQPLEAGSSIEWLVGMYRVLLPSLIGAYTYHLNNTSSMTDGPTMRVLELCLNDDMTEWREGEMLLQSLLIDDSSIDLATSRQADLMKLLRGAGGVTGPGSSGS